MGTLALLESTVVVTVPALAEDEPDEATVVVTVAVPEAEPEPEPEPTAATARVNFTLRVSKSVERHDFTHLDRTIDQM